MSWTLFYLKNTMINPQKTQPSQLPTPSSAQTARSAQLIEQIKQQIAAQGGWMGFDQYMNAALYTPGLGYYANELSPFSMWAEQGDFVTAPLLTPLFGATLAEQALEVFELLENEPPCILEFGAGTGRLAADILRHLAERGIAVRYQIMELSATLQAQQRATIHDALSTIEHTHQIEWLGELPHAFVGLMIGNEVLDAMPVRLIGMDNSLSFERGVSVEHDQLVWQDRPCAEELPMPADWREALRTSQAHYLSETHEQQIAFMHALAHSMQRGVIIMIDYGFPAHEYYHPERSRGTMMCHIQHVAHDEALYYPGVQDITAHVNFSALLPAEDADWQAIGYTSQANFLLNNGILNLLAQIEPEQQRVHANRVQRLLSEAEMGELFKVMAWSKGLDFAEDETLQGFIRGDRLHRL
ncbi:MAG: SAM-dependent methyltransferase [Burkholderiaceae bacterium]|jgi:SAM-dependent MidA family methyltransferase